MSPMNPAKSPIITKNSSNFGKKTMRLLVLGEDGVGKSGIFFLLFLYPKHEVANYIDASNYRKIPVISPLGYKPIIM